MKKKDLIRNAVVVPVISAIIICIAFTLVAKGNMAEILPITQGNVFAYFDSKPDATGKIEADLDKDIPKNEVIGFVKLIGSTINIKYNCDYSSMLNSMSMLSDDVHFGDTGCVYLKALSDSGSILEDEKDIDIESVYGNYRYVIVDKRTVSNEFKALSTPSPKGKSLIIYYQQSDGKGLSSNYRVLIYEEVV